MRRAALVILLVLIAVLTGSPGPVSALEVGDKAPDFALPATTKEKLALSEFAGKKNVVLFGFIGAFTPT
jgi:peroxiredoxin